jgi:uncharacterized protein
MVAPAPTFLADAGGSAVPPCPEASIADLVVRNAYGSLTGTLEVPAGCGPFPVALIIPGSGPNDRNGNSASDGSGANTYALLAAGLRERGIASLRYDKAGLGASVSAAPKREDDFRFEFGADDAARFIPALRADPRFLQVVPMGHSEGALLGLLASKQVAVDRYVSIAGPGRPIGAVLREQLGAQIKDAPLLETANQIITSLEAGKMVAEVPKSLEGLFRPSVQPYLISWMKYDPAEEIRNLRVPALILQGTTDIQVKVEDADRLAAALPAAKPIFLEGMNHTLKAATLEPASQKRAYTDPSLPIFEGLFEALRAFIVVVP